MDRLQQVLQFKRKNELTTIGTSYQVDLISNDASYGKYRIVMPLKSIPTPLMLEMLLPSMYPQQKAIFKLLGARHSLIHPETQEINYIQLSPPNPLLITIVKTINQAFDMNPPIMQGGGVPMAPPNMGYGPPGSLQPNIQHKGQMVGSASPQAVPMNDGYIGATFTNPPVQSVQKKADEISPPDIEKQMNAKITNLQNNELNDMDTHYDLLTGLYNEFDSVQDKKQEFIVLFTETKSKAESNLTKKEKLTVAMENYNSMKAMYDKKRKEYDHLITNLQDSGNKFSKEKITELLDQKLEIFDDKCESIRKKFLKKELDVDTYIKEELQTKTDYYKLRLVKDKLKIA